MTIERFATERMLTNLPKEWIIPSLRISPDGKNVAYQMVKGMGKATRINEFTHPQYNQVSPVIFSPDSKHTVYAAGQNNKQFIVMDGHYHNAYSFVFINTFTFIKDNQTLAYAVQKNDDKFSMVINETEEGKYHNIVQTPLVYNKAGDYAYIIEEINNQSIILNGAQHKTYEKIEHLHFSSKSKELTYLATDNGMQFYVIAGEEQPKHDAVLPIVYSEDKSTFAYIVEDNFKWKIVAPDTPDVVYDEIKSLALSDDGKRLAFSAREQEQWFVVLDGEKQTTYDGIGEMKFSPNGNRFAYKAMRYVKGFLKKTPTSCVVLDNQEGAFYEGIGKTGFNFNPSSTRFAYSVLDKQHSFAVIDGRETIRYDGIGTNTPFFSPKKDHLVLVASFGNNLSVLIDEIHGNIYKSVVMSQGGGIHFTAPDAFHYISLIDEALYLVEEKINYTEETKE